MRTEIEKGEKVRSRDGDIGRTNGNSRVCRLEGCTGRCLSVKWSDGKYTYPCTKGMEFKNGVWHIL